MWQLFLHTLKVRALWMLLLVRFPASESWLRKAIDSAPGGSSCFEVARIRAQDVFPVMLIRSDLENELIEHVVTPMIAGGIVDPQGVILFFADSARSKELNWLGRKYALRRLPMKLDLLRATIEKIAGTTDA